MNKNNSKGNCLPQKLSYNHFLRIMRTSIILLFTCVFCSMAESVYTQEAKVTMNKRNVTVKEVLNGIEAQTDYLFIYNNKVNTDKKVSVRAKRESVADVLNDILRDTDIRYTMEGNHIILFVETVDESAEDTNVLVVQQQRTISGKVTDTSGQPLPGVTIVVKGTTQGTVTDAEGNYLLSNVSNDATLIFSFVGMQTQEIKVDNQTRINVTLQEETIALEEVVAIGYGTMRKVDLTGSVGSVRMDETLQSLPIVDFGKALYGKIPGVQILSSTGRPGQSSTIQVRGVSSVVGGATPLLVIDGVPLPDYDLNSINANDIESIDILKDASSTAIYGSRGANGVILVTTKSGKEGKPRITLNYDCTFQNVIRFVDVMNSAEYAQAHIDAAQNGWKEKGGDPNAPNTYQARGSYLYTWPEAFNHPETLVNTNWQDLIYRTAPMHNIHIGISGGDRNSNYYLSAGYVNQEGIMVLSDYQKFSLNMKANSNITDWLNIGAVTNATFHFEDLYPEDGSSFQNIIQYPPIYPKYGKNGLYGGPSTVEGFENYEQVLYNITGNPFYKHHDSYKENRFDWLGSGFIEIKILPSLKYRSNFNATLGRKERTVYIAVDHNIGAAYLTTGKFQSNMEKRLKYDFENFLFYENKWNDHQLEAMAGYEFNQMKYNLLSGERTHYNDDLLQSLSAGNKITNASDNEITSALISYFIRVNYNYKSKYLATASFRRDGSSKFGPNKKWGNFPSIAVAWRISEESFMDNLKFINNLKLRSSLGYTGNENIPDYAWISTMELARVPFGNYLSTSYYPSSVENPNLRWERTKQYNLGIDLGLINNRIYLEADVYKSISDGLLLDVPVPSVMGFSSILKNIGELENKGIELNLTTQNLVGKLNWQSVFTYSANRNVVTKMGPNDAPRYYGHGHSMPGIDMVGEPVGNFFGYVFDGVFMSQEEVDANKIVYPFKIHPGDAKYKDINGDGVLNVDDRAPIGNPQPDFIWGINNSFKYKNFDLSFLFQGVVGSDLFNGNYRRSMIYHEGRNYLKRLNNRWRSEEEPGDGTVPKISVVLDGFEKTASSFWIVDGSYVRLKNIVFGYNLPAVFVRKMGLSNARIYASGYNVFTITNADTEEPENFNGEGGFTSTIARGVSHGLYPSTKTWTFGININF